MTDLRQLCRDAMADDEKATKGPWTPLSGMVYVSKGITIVAHTECEIAVRAPDGTAQRSIADQEFIAHARTREPILAKSLLAALDVVESVRAYKEELMRPTHGALRMAGPAMSMDEALRRFDAAREEGEK